MIYYQLPNGKVIMLSVEEYLDLTKEDIQYYMSLDYGEYISNPFHGSSSKENCKEKEYDFDYLDSEDDLDDYPSDDLPFDDIIDINPY